MADWRLERSCGSSPGSWLAYDEPVPGIARLRAQLHRDAYARHRHDTYTIALTESGVQEFDYRGAVHRSLPGQVVILHPDEPHDGRPGTSDGFAYRSLYLDPDKVIDAVRAVDEARCDLPFVRNPVVTNRTLAETVAGAFEGALEPLFADALILTIARGLLTAASPDGGLRAPRRVDLTATRRARKFLCANWTRVVRADELERVCGLSRFELGAQFKLRYGTSPYRFMLMRRLEHVRDRLAQGAVLADLAAETGFADQAHMTRAFKATFGLTPGRFAALSLAHGERKAHRVDESGRRIA